jgi:hypothetical protein
VLEQANDIRPSSPSHHRWSQGEQLRSVIGSPRTVMWISTSSRVRQQGHFMSVLSARPTRT